MLSVLVFALAVGLATPILRESAFTAKREYLYKYMAQTVSGIPGASRVYSGVKIMTNVRLQFQTASVVIAQFEDTETYTLNDAIMTQNPTMEQISPHHLTRFFCPVIYKTLTTPFAFRYENGHVFDFETHEYEPYWSANVKRGLVGLLEMNLRQRWTPVKEMENTPSFAAFEVSPTGFCRTRYVIEDTTINPEVPMGTVVVTKTRDFKNCIERPDWFKTMFRPRTCAHCESWTTPGMSEGAQVRYTLKGNRKHFVILSAIAENHVFFHPYKPTRGHMATIVNQTLYLVNAMDMQNTVDTARVANLNMVKRSVITFVPEQVIDTAYPFAGETQIPRSMDEMYFTEKKYLINILKSAAESMAATEVVNMGGFIPIAAVNMMRRANETILREIWMDYAIPKPSETDEDIAMRKVVWNAFAAAGNCMTGKIILESCAIKRNVPPHYCVRLINIMTLANGANSTMIETLLTVATELGGGEDAHLVRALWLGIGALTNKLVYAEKYELMELAKLIPVFSRILATERDPIARRELTAYKKHLLARQQNVARMYSHMRARVVELIKTKLTTAGIEAKLMALKTAGNAGLPELIPLLTTVIMDYSLPEMIRFTAVMALDKMTEWSPVLLKREMERRMQGTIIKNMAPYDRIVTEMEPNMIAEALMPVILRTTDAAPVRIAAFWIVVKASPTRPVFEMLARHIAREPDLQVATYIYTALEAMSNSTHPCFEAIAKEAGRAILMATRVDPSLVYSRKAAFELFKGPWNEYMPAGIGAYLDIIGTNTSMIPAAISFALNTHIVGKSINVFSMNMYTEGLQTALDKIIGPNGVLTNRKSILDIVSPRVRRTTNVDEKIDEIHEKLRVTPKVPPTPRGFISMKLFGYEMRYFSLDEMLERMATAGKITMPYHINDNGATVPIDVVDILHLGDTNIMVPTEAGIPVSMRFAATTALKVKGRVNCKVIPSMFESRRQTPPTEIRAIMDLKPSAIIEINGILGANPFKGTAGVGFRIATRIAAPIRGNVTAVLPSRKIIAAIVPPIQEEPIIEIQAYPVTMQTIAPTNNEKVIEIAEGARIIEAMKEFGNTTMGIDMKARIKIAMPYGNFRAPFIPMAGRCAVQVFMKPGPSPPAAVVLQTQVAAGAPVKSGTGSPSNIQSSCDCAIGRWTMCLVSCDEADATDPRMMDSSVTLEDFPDLSTKDVTITELKAKLQAKLGTSVILSPVGLKWGIVTTIDASSPAIPRKMQFEALWQSVNKESMHQIVMRLTRSPLPMHPNPWEMITTALLQYPRRIIHPKMLLDPSYHTQIHHDLHFMTRFMHHRPILATLNETVSTIVERNIQHLMGTPKPDIILRTLLIQIMARTNEAEVRSLIPIWREIALLKLWKTEIRNTAIDPIHIIRHAEHIITKLATIEKIQMTLVEKVRELKQTFPSTTIYIPILQHCIFEHYDILTMVRFICYRAMTMDIVPQAATLFAKAQKLMENLDEEIIQYSEILMKIPSLEMAGITDMGDSAIPVKGMTPTVPPYGDDTMETPLTTVWPKLEKISETQFEALKVMLMTRKKDMIPSLQPAIDVIGLTKEVAPTLFTIMKNTDIKIIQKIIPVINKIAIQHMMIYHTLRTIVETTSPIVLTSDTKFNHVLRSIKTQAGTLAVVSATVVDALYEILSLEPIVGEAEIIAVKTLFKIQMMIGHEMSRVYGLHTMVPGMTAGEVPEEVFSIADGVIETVGRLATKIDFITKKITTASVGPTISIFTRALQTVRQIKLVVTQLKVYVIRNLVISSETARAVDVVRRCNALETLCTTLEVRVTKAFTTIYNSASQPDIATSTPMPTNLIMVALSATAMKQREIITEIDRIVTMNKRVATKSMQPEIETLIDTCKGLQGQIDWIQLWGIPLGTMRPLFSRVITMQQEIIKKMREAVTASESQLDNPVAVNLELEDLQGELAKIVKIGSLEAENIGPIPTIKNIPASVHINPITKMVSKYLPLAVTGYCNITFGNVGFTPKTVVMKLYASKSFEQLLWENRQINPLTRDPGLEITLAREEIGTLADIPEHPVWMHLNSLHHRHLIVKYMPDDIPERVTFALRRVINFFATRHYWSTSLEAPVQRTPGLVHIVNNARMNSPAGDWFVMTPNMTISARGVYSPIIKLVTLPIAFTKPPISRRIALTPYIGSRIPTTCKAYYETIRTFDGVEFTLPNIGTCAAVLAMDCTPAKTFAIILRTDTANFNRKIIEIMAEGKMLHVAATTTGATMSVDGNPITVTRMRPYFLEKTVAYGEAAVFLKVSQDKMFHIDLPLLGIYIITDGNYIAIKASPMFRLKTCGLCSNMDGQTHHEYQAPDGRVFYNPEPFIASNIIKTPSCPALTRPGGPITNGMLATCTPVMRRIIRQRTKSNKVCVSFRTIKQCVRPCKPTRRIRVTVPFYCMLNTDPEAARVIAKIEANEPISMKGWTPNAKYPIREPESCQ